MTIIKREIILPDKSKCYDIILEDTEDETGSVCFCCASKEVANSFSEALDLLLTNFGFRN